MDSDFQPPPPHQENQLILTSIFLVGNLHYESGVATFVRDHQMPNLRQTAIAFLLLYPCIPPTTGELCHTSVLQLAFDIIDAFNRSTVGKNVKTSSPWVYVYVLALTPPPLVHMVYAITPPLVRIYIYQIYSPYNILWYQNMLVYLKDHMLLKSASAVSKHIGFTFYDSEEKKF